MIKLLFKAYKKTFLCYFFILKIITQYFQENEEKLSKKASIRYQNLSEEEKYKNHQCACEWYGNVSEEKK